MHACMHPSIHTYLLTYIHTYIHTYTHISVYTFTYIYTYIHTYIRYIRHQWGIDGDQTNIKIGKHIDWGPAGSTPWKSSMGHFRILGICSIARVYCA